MLTGPYFFSFDTKSKPGSIIAHAVRFETIEFPHDSAFDATQFPILCPDHEELKTLPLNAFAEVVHDNFLRG